MANMRSFYMWSANISCSSSEIFLSGKELIGAIKEIYQFYEATEKLVTVFLASEIPEDITGSLQSLQSL